jgi:hypothetical protein
MLTDGWFSCLSAVFKHGIGNVDAVSHCSAVELNLAKVGVEGSNPFARSGSACYSNKLEGW